MSLKRSITTAITVSLATFAMFAATDGHAATAERVASRDEPGTRSPASQVARGTDTFAYAYDADGRVASRTYPGESAVAYAYDVDGRLEQVGTGADATSYGYDLAGNHTSTTLPNGIRALSH